MSFSGADAFIPRTTSLRRLAQAVDACRGCPLYRDATQAVFGEGRASSGLMLVGEQPGDREDKEGRPFVGPAGLLLERALGEADVARESVYVTNVVKHFKHEQRGKRRIHKKPNNSEIEACRPWLLRELDIVAPRVLVALGATAAQALFGPRFSLLAMHGRIAATPWSSQTLATIHPSAALRARDDDRKRLFRMLVADLRIARKAASGDAAPAQRL